MKLRNPILFLASLLPLCFLAGCEYGPKRPETKHLTLNFKTRVDYSSNEKCFYSDTGDYFWFTYENLSECSEEGGFSRFEENGEAAAMSYWKTDIESIKGSININGKNYPVVEIGEGCFMGENFPKPCFINNRVIIPNSVRTISHQAFGRFEFKDGIDSGYVFIPNSVKFIPDQAFYGDEKIRCQAPSKPDGWSEGWQYGCDVTFGCSE